MQFQCLEFCGWVVGEVGLGGPVERVVGNVNVLAVKIVVDYFVHFYDVFGIGVGVVVDNDVEDDVVICVLVIVGGVGDGGVIESWDVVVGSINVFNGLIVDEDVVPVDLVLVDVCVGVVEEGCLGGLDLFEEDVLLGDVVGWSWCVLGD